jgi:DNA primase large subunit
MEPRHIFVNTKYKVGHPKYWLRIKEWAVSKGIVDGDTRKPTNESIDQFMIYTHIIIDKEDATYKYLKKNFIKFYNEYVKMPEYWEENVSIAKKSQSVNPISESLRIKGYSCQWNPHQMEL